MLGLYFVGLTSCSHILTILGDNTAQHCACMQVSAAAVATVAVAKSRAQRTRSPSPHSQRTSNAPPLTGPEVASAPESPREDGLPPSLYSDVCDPRGLHPGDPHYKVGCSPPSHVHA